MKDTNSTERKSEFRIVVLPGDGIGPEVIDAAIEVLQSVERQLSGVRFKLEEHSVGAREYLKSGDPLPETAFQACSEADATLLGAMGLPEVRWPDGREMTPQIDLRERLDLYAGIRPVRLYHGSDSPLKGYEAGGIDFVIVRESTEGLFHSRHEPRGKSDQLDFVCDRMMITRKGAERVCRSAFELAMTRRKKVTLVDKANVLPSMVFFREIFEQVAQDFPEVQINSVYVDAAALFLVQRPQSFDVLVTENMFGDILSDLAASIVGGMGMAPSADLGDRCGVFQPAHGTAPDIAGQGKANPIATILSVALMLEWLPNGESHRGGALIREATEEVLADPTNRTPDLKGTMTTRQLGNLIANQIGK